MGTSIPLAGGQDPSNVAITGGSITGTSVQGFTPTQLANYLGFVGDWWAQKQFVTALGAVPAITGWKDIPVLTNAMSQAAGAATADAGIEGGGVAPNNATRILSGTIFQNPAGGNWAVFFRASFGALTTAVNGEVGITSSDGLNGVYFGAVNVTNTTHFVGSIFAAAAGTTNVTLGAADTAMHDIGITDDGTTIKFWVDGVLSGSTTTRTNVPSGIGHQIFVYANTTGICKCARAVAFYVQP